MSDSLLENKLSVVITSTKISMGISIMLANLPTNHLWGSRFVTDELEGRSAIQFMTISTSMAAWVFAILSLLVPFILEVRILFGVGFGWWLEFEERVASVTVSVMESQNVVGMCSAGDSADCLRGFWTWLVGQRWARSLRCLDRQLHQLQRHRILCLSYYTQRKHCNMESSYALVRTSWHTQRRQLQRTF